MAVTVPTITLNTGYRMPVLGLGTFNKLKKGEITQAVKAALQCGYRMIDTGWVYQSEGEVGEAIANSISSGTLRREDLFITAKLWNTFHGPDRVEVGLKESMAELKVDYVDLYLIHWPMAFKEPEDPKAWIMSTDIQPEDTDYLETWRAMEKLVEKGLARTIGVSNFNITQLKRLLSAENLKYKPANMQVEVHPYFDNSELISFCKEHGITITAYSPLAKGGQEYAGKPIPQMLQEPILLDLARKYNKTPAQIALRWGIQRGYSMVPKSITPHRIAENIQLFDFELTSDEMETVSSLNKDLRLVTLENYKTFPEYPFK